MSKIKVVYNGCFGGFSLSRAAMQFLANKGNKEAQEVMAEEDFYGYLYDTPRHDPLLVQAVEVLGDDANGTSSALRVAEIEGNRYIIEEYDGAESVKTPEDIAWVEVK